MTTVQARKVGNSIGIIIPAEYGIEVGVELLIGKGTDGQLIITTPLADPFANTDDFKSMSDEFGEVVPASKEWGSVNEQG